MSGNTSGAMNCRTVRTVMQDILDGKTVSEDVHDSIDDHMDECHACSELNLADCATFRRLEPDSLDDEGHSEPLIRILDNHRESCPDCENWSLRRYLTDNGVENIDDYPCLHVALHAHHDCDQHEDAWECPDTLLVRLDDGSFAMPIRDGGTSYVPITHCPWCGTKV